MYAMMKLLLLLNILCSSMAFVPFVSQQATIVASSRATSVRALEAFNSNNGMAAVASSFAFLPAGAAMATEEIEIAELPPVYVPVLFGIVLLVGVGLLTSSLGNVMDEESSLGMQSGARAKKEAERSRSSYFKK
jgi:hypothetical protein